MNKLDYNPQMHTQVQNYCNDVPLLIDGFKKAITEERFIPDDVLKTIDRVRISGSGDCWAASCILQDVFRKYLGKHCECQAATPIELSRYKSYRENDPTTLSIVLSVWGFPSRLVENLDRAAKYNAPTIALTEKANSPVGLAAKYILNTHNSKIALEAKAGCCTYLGVLVSGSLLAAYISEVKGISPAGTVDQLAASLLKYSEMMQAQMEAIDDKVFTVAKKWEKDVTGVMAVGDGSDFASALFFPAKLTETYGMFGGFTNSIEWRKSQNHIKDPEKTGVIFFIRKNYAGKESLVKAVELAVSKKFKTLVVSDASPAELKMNCDVDFILIPAASKEEDYIESFFNHLPGDLLASYLCEFWGGSYFRSAVIEETEYGVNHKEGNSIWAVHGINTLQTSKQILI